MSKISSGIFGYLLFYFLCGIIASTVQIYIVPVSSIPMLGASGAISGVLAAYLLMFPKARVVTLIQIFIFIKVAELPAYLLIGFWIVLQFFYGMLSLGHHSATQGGIAWWAHIGGFIGGLVLVIPFRKYK